MQIINERKESSQKIDKLSKNMRTIQKAVSRKMNKNVDEINNWKNLNSVKDEEIKMLNSKISDILNNDKNKDKYQEKYQKLKYQ